MNAASANTFFSPGIWVVCSRPLKNDEQAVQHYYLRNDRQAVEHYQRTADAGRLYPGLAISIWLATLREHVILRSPPNISSI